MPVSNYDNVTSSEKNITKESASFSAPNESVNTSKIGHNSSFSTVTANNNNNITNTTGVIENRHVNNNNASIPITTNNKNNCTMNTLANESMHLNSEIIYARGSYDASGISYIPPTMAEGTTIPINNKRNPLNHQYVYEHKIPTSEASPKTYEYSQLETVPYENITSTYENRPYDIDSNMMWKNNGYSFEKSPYAEVPVQSGNNNFNKTYNVNYMCDPQTNTIPAMHKSAPIKMKQMPNSVYAQKNIAFYEPTNRSPLKQHNLEGYVAATPDVAPYASARMIPYGASPTAPRYVPCKVNPILNKKYDPFFKHNASINYMPRPDYSSQISNYESMSSDHIQYDPMRPMMAPSPIAPVSYFMMKENDKRCILQKGVDYALNKCKGNKSPHYSKHEYFIKGARDASIGTVLPYVTFEENKKFDMFKKLTLKVGTCLDDLINVFIESLNTSIEVLHKNNEVRLHDLHPFYNPDPIYTRPERPTLRTGNNIIDNINTALDGTTLEKHKNIPQPNARIPIPKTEKTGHVVVDGLNNILDNLLNEPLSYHKYDYYSDKVNIASRSK